MVDIKISAPEKSFIRNWRKLCGSIGRFRGRNLEKNRIFAGEIFTMSITCARLKEEETALSYTLIVKKVVNRYVSTSLIPAGEREDVEMSIIGKFTAMLPRIDSAYEGKSKRSTYYTAVINRMCCEVIRAQKKHWDVVKCSYEEVINSGPFHLTSLEKQLHYNMEVRRLSNVLQLFDKDQAKIRLFIKYYFQLPLTMENLNDYSSQKAPQLMKILGTKPAKKSEIFEQLALVVNIAEDKNIKADAIRMWLHKQIDIIITRMNNQRCSSYCRESIELLFEIAYNESLLILLILIGVIL